MAVPAAAETTMRTYPTILVEEARRDWRCAGCKWTIPRRCRYARVLVTWPIRKFARYHVECAATAKEKNPDYDPEKKGSHALRRRFLLPEGTRPPMRQKGQRTEYVDSMYDGREDPACE